MNNLARIQQKGIVMFFKEAGSPKSCSSETAIKTNCPHALRGS